MDSATTTIHGATLAVSADEEKWTLSAEIPASADFIPATRAVMEFLREQSDVMRRELAIAEYILLHRRDETEEGGSDG